ncbi:hypothetical protein BC826DRAFT_1018046 [Russula brevipes]|nr:hypothetical protein BC826DRAFT_1018046 [Russula brevipes]
MVHTKSWRWMDSCGQKLADVSFDEINFFIGVIHVCRSSASLPTLTKKQPASAVLLPSPSDASTFAESALGLVAVKACSGKYYTSFIPILGSRTTLPPDVHSTRRQQSLQIEKAYAEQRCYRRRARFSDTFRPHSLQPISNDIQSGHEQHRFLGKNAWLSALSGTSSILPPLLSFLVHNLTSSVKVALQWKIPS